MVRKRSPTDVRPIHWKNAPPRFFRLRLPQVIVPASPGATSGTPSARSRIGAMTKGNAAVNAAARYVTSRSNVTIRQYGAK